MRKYIHMKQFPWKWKKKRNIYRMCITKWKAYSSLFFLSSVACHWNYRFFSMETKLKRTLLLDQFSYLLFLSSLVVFHDSSIGLKHVTGSKRYKTDESMYAHNNHHRLNTIRRQTKIAYTISNICCYYCAYAFLFVLSLLCIILVVLCIFSVRNVLLPPWKFQIQAQPI